MVEYLLCVPKQSNRSVYIKTKELYQKLFFIIKEITYEQKYKCKSKQRT